LYKDEWIKRSNAMAVFYINEILHNNMLVPTLRTSKPIAFYICSVIEQLLYKNIAVATTVCLYLVIFIVAYPYPKETTYEPPDYYD
jgi:hypothetical protein